MEIPGKKRRVRRKNALEERVKGDPESCSLVIISSGGNEKLIIPSKAAGSKTALAGWLVQWLLPRLGRKMRMMGGRYRTEPKEGDENTRVL